MKWPKLWRPRSRISTSSIVGIAFSIVASTSYAWNRGGHLVSGALAYSELVKSSPQQVDAAITVLQAHPAYSHWQKEISDSERLDQRKALFMLAAAWPDDVRRGQFKRFDHPNWHYVNFGFTPGQPLTNVLLTEPFQGQLLDALRSNLTLYKDPKASVAERAVALSWVLHLTGDITQPLHVTALVNKDFPGGDRGGNEIRVAGSERARKGVKLHKMWDDGASGPGVSLSRAANIAVEVAPQMPRMPAVLDPGRVIRNEAAASYRLAVDHVYLNGKLAYAVDDDTDAPLVPPDYTKQLKAMSLQQMLRAAALLVELLR